MISSNDCDKHNGDKQETNRDGDKHNRKNIANLNVTSFCNNDSFKMTDNGSNANNSANDNNSDNNNDMIVSCNNDKSHNIVNSTININNSTNSNDSVNNMTMSCNNVQHCNIVDSTINVNNSMSDADFNSNAISSLDNELNHDTINDKNNDNNSTGHVNSNNNSNNITFSNVCDQQNRIRSVNLNVTFSCDNGKSYETIDNGISTNNFTSSNNPDNMTFSCNDKDCNIVNSTINANNDTYCVNNMTSSCDNGKSIGSDINNFTNSDDSYNNAILSCDNGSVNNSLTGVILNDVIFPFDDGNNSNNIFSILSDVTKSKTSTNCNDNNTFSCNDNNTNNSLSVNTTNISEYLPSTSEITTEIEAVGYEQEIEHESIHNISTNNDKNYSESLIDISSVNTFGCKEDNMSVPFSQPKGLKKKNFCYYCKKFQSKIARHLENVHKLEPEVKKFLLLPKGDYILKSIDD